MDTQQPNLISDDVLADLCTRLRSLGATHSDLTIGAEAADVIKELSLRAQTDNVEAMKTALNWYAEMAQTMRRATLHVDNQVALHILKELALDGGKMARLALKTFSAEITCSPRS